MRFITKERINALPQTPGVYAFKNKEGILYIGKAVNLRERVKNHFQQPSYRDGLFMNQVRKIGYIQTPSEIDALLLESAMIKKHQPKYNVFWKDDKKYFYAAITKDLLPRVLITHQPSSQKKAKLIGPYVDGTSLKLTLRYLRKIFPYYTAATHSPLPCGYCHLGLCPGPIPDITAYKKNLQNLASVLKGKRTSVIRRLKKEMALLSKNRQYERAGILRDQVFALENIAKHRFSRQIKEEKLEDEQEYKAVEQSLQKIFHTAKPMSRVEEFDVSNIQGTAATGSMVVFVEGRRAPQFYRKFKIRAEAKPNDVAMMKEIISRRMRHPEWKYPDLMIIDGGKGQLRSALSAISQYQNKEEKTPFFIAALAKRKTELFLPGRKESAAGEHLPLDARRFLLRMRDEAHRFAISYHKILRRKNLLP